VRDAELVRPRGRGSASRHGGSGGTATRIQQGPRTRGALRSIIGGDFKRDIPTRDEISHVTDGHGRRPCRGRPSTTPGRWGRGAATGPGLTPGRTDNPWGEAGGGLLWWPETGRIVDLHLRGQRRPPGERGPTRGRTHAARHRPRPNGHTIRRPTTGPSRRTCVLKGRAARRLVKRATPAAEERSGEQTRRVGTWVPWFIGGMSTWDGRAHRPPRQFARASRWMMLISWD